METIKSRCIVFKSNLLNSEVIEIVNYYFNSDIYKDINLDFINNYNSPSFLIVILSIVLTGELAWQSTDLNAVKSCLPLRYFIYISYA